MQPVNTFSFRLPLFPRRTKDETHLILVCTSILLMTFTAAAPPSSFLLRVFAVHARPRLHMRHRHRASYSKHFTFQQDIASISIRHRLVLAAAPTSYQRINRSSRPESWYPAIQVADPGSITGSINIRWQILTRLHRPWYTVQHHVMTTMPVSCSCGIASKSSDHLV
jgi:hypothetical protein